MDHEVGKEASVNHLVTPCYVCDLGHSLIDPVKRLPYRWHDNSQLIFSYTSWLGWVSQAGDFIFVSLEYSRNILATTQNYSILSIRDMAAGQWSAAQWSARRETRNIARVKKVGQCLVLGHVFHERWR